MLFKIRRLQTTTTTNGQRMADVERRTADVQRSAEGRALSATWPAVQGQGRSTLVDGSPTCHQHNSTTVVRKVDEVGARRVEALDAVVVLTTRRELCQHDL